MQRDIRFVAYHPAIVAGPDVKQISRPHLVVAASLHSTSGTAGYDHADMFDFAKRRSGRRSHMLRPFQSRLITGPPIVLDPIFTVSSFPSSNVCTSSLGLDRFRNRSS